MALGLSLCGVTTCYLVTKTLLMKKQIEQQTYEPRQANQNLNKRFYKIRSLEEIQESNGFGQFVDIEKEEITR